MARRGTNFRTGERRCRLVLGVGREPPDAALTRSARVLAESLHVPVAEFAGDHVGYVTNPAEFAPQLAALLSSR